MPDAPLPHDPDQPQKPWIERLKPSNWKAPKIHAPNWTSWSRTERIGAISLASVLAVLVLGWVGLNFALTDPKIATPAINWGLHAFGNKTANIETGRLDKPFTSRFTMKTLDWPARAEAEEIAVTVDLFGFMPGRPWAKEVRIRNGEIILSSDERNPTTLKPQDLVDRIDAKNVAIRFTRRGKLHEVMLVSADGSFANGTVKAEAVAGTNTLSFDGLRREGGGFGGSVTAKGENLKELAEIVGASAPDTPPFDVKGELATHMKTWDVSGLSGRVGDSDIGGRVIVDLREKKPFLSVNLTSRELDFDDLGVVFGIPVGTGKGETTNDEQREAKAKFDRSARLIPDTRIDFARLRAVNGDFQFNAVKVVDAPAGINALAFTGTLRDQMLDFSKVDVKTGKGDLSGKVQIDARKDPATTKASGVLRQVAISRVIPTDYLRGTMNGKFALNLTGSGFRQAFGSATGEVGLWSTDSELAKIATEAAGLDVGEILLILAKGDDGKRQYLKSTCLAVNLAVADGRATLAPAVLDNRDSLILATGGFDLKTEALDVKLFSEPKDVSIGKLVGDIYVRGTLRNPDIQAPGPKGIVQAGIAGLLSTIAGPLAALPFIELGGGPDAPCGQLIADAKEAGQSQDPTLKKRGAQKS